MLGPPGACVTHLVTAHPPRDFSPVSRFTDVSATWAPPALLVTRLPTGLLRGSSEWGLEALHPPAWGREGSGSWLKPQLVGSPVLERSRGVFLYFGAEFRTWTTVDLQGCRGRGLPWSPSHRAPPPQGVLNPLSRCPQGTLHVCRKPSPHFTAVLGPRNPSTSLGALTYSSLQMHIVGAK